jgi:transposase
MTTKILALTDALGNLVRFDLLPGHRYDTIGVPPLLEGIDFAALIADKAFDSNAIIADLNARGAKIVISQHPRRTRKLPLDAEMYKWRHLIETSSANSKSSNASPCALTKLTRVSTPSSISPPL